MSKFKKPNPKIITGRLDGNQVNEKSTRCVFAKSNQNRKGNMKNEKEKYKKSSNKNKLIKK